MKDITIEDVLKKHIDEYNSTVNDMHKFKLSERELKMFYAAMTEYVSLNRQGCRWAKASERKPERQVAAKRDGKYGILSPWFNDTYWFWTTDFADREAFDVTNELETLEYFSESIEPCATSSLVYKIEFWSKKYEFSFQFWGEGQNNVYINKDFVEIASFGGKKTIDDIFKKVIEWCEKANPRIKYPQ